MAMQIADILEKTEASREQLDLALDGLSPEQMGMPGVMGVWSVKDILAHIAVWQSRLVRLLFQLARQQKPQWDMRDVDGINAQIYAQQKDRPLDLVLEDMEGVFEQGCLRLEALREADLVRRVGNATLAEIIAANTYEHDDEHAAQIAAWRSQLPPAAA